MPRLMTCAAGVMVLSWMVSSTITGVAQQPRTASPQQIDLAERLSAGKLRVVNRDVASVQGTRGIHLSEREGNGVAWIEGTEFGLGTIELEIRGRDLFQRSFVGVAFHRRDDEAYEAVYLRPFNFRSTDPVRHMHAVQYVAIPDYDWPLLREKFPEEFENPVDPTIEPTGGFRSESWWNRAEFKSMWGRLSRRR